MRVVSKVITDHYISLYILYIILVYYSILILYIMISNNFRYNSHINDHYIDITYNYFF